MFHLTVTTVRQNFIWNHNGVRDILCLLPLRNNWRHSCVWINCIAQKVLLIRVLKELKVSWYSLLPFRCTRGLSRARFEHYKVSSSITSWSPSSVISCTHCGSLAHEVSLHFGHLELRNIPLSSLLLGFSLHHEAWNIALQIRCTNYHRIIIRSARDRLMPQSNVCISVVSSSWNIGIYKLFQFKIAKVTWKSVGSWTRSLWHLLAMLNHISVRSIFPGGHCFIGRQMISTVCIIIGVISTRARNCLCVFKSTVIEPALSRTEVCCFTIWNSW